MSVVKFIPTTGVVLSNFDKTMTVPGSAYRNVVADSASTSGKTQWEYIFEASVGGEDTGMGIVVTGATIGTYGGFNSDSWALYENGQLYHNNAILTNLGSLSVGDVVTILIDWDNGDLTINSPAQTFTQAIPVGVTSLGPLATSRNGESVTGNFRADEITLNAGYEALEPVGVELDPATVTGGTFLLEDSNRRFTEVGNLGTYTSIRPTVETQKDSGVWYWETKVITDGGDQGHGIAEVGVNPEWVGQDSVSWAMYASNVWHNGGILAAIGHNQGDTLRHKLDLDLGTYEIAINSGSFNLITNLLPSGTTFSPRLSGRGQSVQAVEFDSANFEFAIPAGASAFDSGSPAPEVIPFALAGEGYTDVASIDVHPDWDSTNVVSVARDALPNGPVGERWFMSDVNANETLDLSFTPDPGPNTYEISMALDMTELTGSSTGLFQMHYDNAAAILSLGYEIANQRLQPVILIGGTTSLEGLNPFTPGDIVKDQINLFQLRLRGESAIGASDGLLEIWNNSVLIGSDTSVDWGGVLDTSEIGGPMLFKFLPNANANVYTKNLVVKTEQTTADGVAPTIYAVTDEGSSVESVIEVPLSYYFQPPAAVLSAIGADDYTTNASLNLHPDWTFNNNTQTVERDYLPGHVPGDGERWLFSPVQGGVTMISEEFPLPEPTFELSMAYHSAPAGNGRGVFQHILTGGVPAGSFGAFSLNFNSDGTAAVDFGPQNVSATNTGPGFNWNAEQVHYIVGRFKRQSAVNTADGEAEVWINGRLCFAYTDIDCGNGYAATWTEVTSRPNPQSLSDVKNVILRDGWSTSPGVEPLAYRVVDDAVTFDEQLIEVPLSYYVGEAEVEVAEVIPVVMTDYLDPSVEVEVADVDIAIVAPMNNPPTEVEIGELDLAVVTPMNNPPAEVEAAEVSVSIMTPLPADATQVELSESVVVVVTETDLIYLGIVDAPNTGSFLVTPNIITI